MITKTFWVAAAFIAVGSTAYAGPCTERITQIDRTLSMSDAGSGPTTPMTGPATGSIAATPSAAPKAGEAPGKQGTAAMNDTVGAKAASPADVRAQTQGSPTAAQGGAQNQSAQVSTALSQAKAADAKGDEAACSRAVDEAERLMKG